jgi:DNA-directed RNA polymerase subunit RPC12/RpoP
METDEIMCPECGYENCYFNGFSYECPECDHEWDEDHWHIDDDDDDDDDDFHRHDDDQSDDGGYFDPEDACEDWESYQEYLHRTAMQGAKNTDEETDEDEEIDEDEEEEIEEVDGSED